MLSSLESSPSAARWGGSLRSDRWPCRRRSVGGWTDSSVDTLGHRPLVNFYSVGKALVALLALQLVDEHAIGLDTPIASVWPEFAEGGKSETTLRQALCHRAGVPAIRQPLTDADLWTWDRMAQPLAATDPWWEPGTRHAYHTNTYGHLIGEIIRRVSGQTCSDRLRAVVGPLDADVWFGVPVREQPRCASVLWQGSTTSTSTSTRCPATSS